LQALANTANPSTKRGETMETFYQTYEKAPAEITTPEELLGRAVRVTFYLLDEGEPTLAELAAKVGVKLGDVKDLHALRFMGSMPDFPPRGPQGEYEVRPKLDSL
jgi:hypothetical protein